MTVHFCTVAMDKKTAVISSAAEKLLERLVQFSQDYRRNADGIEELHYGPRMKWTRDSVKALTAAITKAAGLRITTPIIKEDCIFEFVGN